MDTVTPSQILCCVCGASIQSNPTNMCEACLTSECDITANIPKQHTITFCPKCNRFLNPPSQWIPAALESPELLSLCLKRVKGIGKENKLKEASFIYTEPHSRRLIVQIKLRGEIFANTVVEQTALLHYTMLPQQCRECARHEAKDYWNACVQIRQRVEHKRTLSYLEQLLLRKSAPRKYSNVKLVKGGFDFFFATRSEAVAFVEYVNKLIPCRSQTSQQLKSHDVHNNTYNYKFTFCLEVVPVCKNDVVCVSKSFAQRLGLASQILLVCKITNTIRLLDPVSCVIKDVDVNTYFANPFTAISNGRNVVEFFVMDMDPVEQEKSQPSTKQTNLKSVGVWVVPSAHLGVGGEDGDQVYVRTHLGHILKIGDTVIGLDLRNANINNDDYESISEDKRPQVVLIKRPSRPHKRRRRGNFSIGENSTELITSEMDVVSSGDLNEGDDGDDDFLDSDSSDEEYVDAEGELQDFEHMETGDQ